MPQKAEILLKLVLNTNQSINQSINSVNFSLQSSLHLDFVSFDEE
jgi:hypothetical protein